MLRRPVQYTADDVGGVFLDFLFGFVAASIFEAATKPELSSVRLAQLCLAGAATLTSWIGYHQSEGRTPVGLEYFNLPLLQFAVHLGLVVSFFLMAARTEKPGAPASAVPEAIITAVIFTLYFVWEAISHRVWHDSRYREALPSEPRWNDLRHDPPTHPQVTAIFTIVAIGQAIGVQLWDPSRPGIVLGIDVVLIGVVLMHRFFQGVYGVDAASVAPPDESR